MLSLSYYNEFDENDGWWTWWIFAFNSSILSGKLTYSHAYSNILRVIVVLPLINRYFKAHIQISVLNTTFLKTVYNIVVICMLAAWQRMEKDFNDAAECCSVMTEYLLNISYMPSESTDPSIKENAYTHWESIGIDLSFPTRILLFLFSIKFGAINLLHFK